MLRIGFWCFFLFSPLRAHLASHVLRLRFLKIASSSSLHLHINLSSPSSSPHRVESPALALILSFYSLLLKSTLQCLVPSISERHLLQISPSIPPLRLVCPFGHRPVNRCQIPPFRLFFFLSFFLFCIFAPPPCLSRGHFAPLA